MAAAHSRRQRLADIEPALERVLKNIAIDVSAESGVSAIRCETVWVTMRDGVRLATDIYLPPARPAPAIVMRTPYGRAMDGVVGVFLSLARRGYVVISQDCRGTGDSEPDRWDYYMYESEDGFDFVEWAAKQDWFNGFIGACGGSYIAQTQWCMATHPRMSTIVPQVSGLGIAINTTHLHMWTNAYALSIGKGESKVPVHYTEMERLVSNETMTSGYFNEPLHRAFSAPLIARYPELRTLPPDEAKRWLWEQYCSLSGAQRAEFVKRALGTTLVTSLEVEALSAIFGQRVSHDAHALPHCNPSELCRLLHAPALMITGWYDWGLNDALATWALLTREAQEPVRSRSRLIITPSAHNMPGYLEGVAGHIELFNSHRYNVELLLRWYSAMREGTAGSWPRVIYYLMGANDWCVAVEWPPPGTRLLALYLGSGGVLTCQRPDKHSFPDRYTYEPGDPTPTVGGSIVSYVYSPGSVNVAEVQKRSDVLTYTTRPFESPVDVVGPLRLILYASSSAVDTDFSARICDVFPDGRSIQLQSGILRARFRNGDFSPELLEPGHIYRLDIDMWATANRFRRGHRLRVDICSADFPRFDRNTNRGGRRGDPIPAHQTIYHDSQYPSHLLVSTQDPESIGG